MDDTERALIVSRLDRMKLLMADLDRAATADERQKLKERLSREIEAARIAVTTYRPHQ